MNDNAQMYLYRLIIICIGLPYIRNHCYKEAKKGGSNSHRFPVEMPNLSADLYIERGEEAHTGGR
jgi:hypothetical protein